MYTKTKAEKLKHEFEYLIDTPYFPFGKSGRVFKITKIEAKLSELRIPPLERAAKRRENPNYDQIQQENHESGNNWNVVLTVTDKGDNFEVELEEALQVLEIRHDIDKIFN